MNCEELRNLLHGYVDSELDLVRNLEIEQHLQECSRCAGAVSRHRVLRAALREGQLYHRAPTALQERVRSSLRRAHKPRIVFAVFIRRGTAVAASLALLALLMWGMGQIRSVPQREVLLAQEVVSSHVRSLQGNHLVDIVSTDQHTVKPWFNGRVDFSPTVKDLASDGYPLVGGRLDYVDNSETAALVYKRHQHLINVLIWPATTDADQATRQMTRREYHLVHWTKAGLNYWVISDLNEKELREFVELFGR